MKIAIVMPRGMRFGPEAATSIDLCVRDAVWESRFHETTTVICEEVAQPFPGFKLKTYRKASKITRIREIAGIVRALDPDLIVVQQHLPTASALASKFPNYPVMLHKHNFVTTTSGFRRFRRYRELNKLAGITFVSQAGLDRFALDYPKCRAAKFVALNGLPTQEWAEEAEKLNQIIAVGRIESRKGMVEIADALARVLPDFPEWNAKIIGSMSDEEETNQAFDTAVKGVERLQRTGALSHREVVSAVCSSRIAVVNSREEAFGRVALEGMAGGAALVTTRVGGLREVVGDACVPLLHGSSDEIETGLRALMTDPHRCDRLAEEGRERFQNNFTIKHTASSLDDAYEELTHSRLDSVASYATSREAQIGNRSPSRP
ncbi:MAG: glycosyltransferase family 4 protein [Pseudomonadota bacterium]